MTWLIADLTKQERLLLMLASDGLSPAEIAVVLSIDEADVRRMHSDVMRRVKERLEGRNAA